MEPVGILTFTLSGESYGIAAISVREIMRATHVVTIEGAPSAVQGAVEYDGELIPVLDLHEKLGLGSRPPAPSDQLIIAESESGPLALDVDAIVSLIEAPEPRLTLEEWPLSGEASPAIGCTSHGLRVIHDLNRLLTVEERRAFVSLSRTRVPSGRRASRTQNREVVSAPYGSRH